MGVDNAHDYTDDDVKDLVHRIETTDSAEPAPAKNQEEQQAQETMRLVFDHPDKLMGHKLKYQANGKEVEEDIATILKRASQGYNYAQSVNALKSQQNDVAERMKAAEEMTGKWSKFEQYAKENPAWYQHWTNAWENRSQQSQGAPQGQQPTGQSGDMLERINQLLDERLKPMQEHFTKQQLREQETAIREQDKVLDEQIKSTRKKYPSIDFDKTDPETGKSLEYSVLEFAQQNKIYDFGNAFKAFYHDNLVASEVENKKADWAKEQQENVKKGILGETAPKKGQAPAKSYKDSSWDQLTDHVSQLMGFGS